MKLLVSLLALATLLSFSEGVMVCYYGSWAVYRPGNGKFDIGQIDPNICTHLVFGFAGINGNTNEIKVLDPYNELCADYGRCGFKRFTALKKQNSKLVTTLAVGGWNEGSKKYSNMAKDPKKRETFITSTIKLLKKHNFDGLDMDWEYPTLRGGAPEDKANFVILMQELRVALHAEDLILTAAVSAGKATIDAAYDVPAFSDAVDFIHVMTYDMHGSWDTYTHHHTILYEYPKDTGDNKFFNVDYAIQYWIKLGADKSKLVMGTGSYGRCWRLDSATDTGMYASASSPSQAGIYTEEPGMLGFNEICEHSLKNSWTIIHEPSMNEPYCYDLNFGMTWCGYDDVTSANIKAKYARDQNLAGMMMWSIETDDFLAQCHSRAFPLIKGIHETFIGAELTTPIPPTTTTRDPNAPTTTTVSTTTTTVPSFPTGGPGEHCEKPGNNPDPADCTIFYECVFTGTGYTEYVYHCPEGTLFNPLSLICDYDYTVCALQPPVCPNNCPV